MATKRDTEQQEEPVTGKVLEATLAKELKPIRDSIDLLQGKVASLDLDNVRHDRRFDALEETQLRMEGKLDYLVNTLDGFVGTVATLDQENKFGAVILSRHDIQIRELATATGTTISG